MALKTLDKLRSTFRRKSSSNITASLGIADDVDDLEARTIYGTRTHDWSRPKQKWQGEQTPSSPELEQESDFDKPDTTQLPQTAATSPMFDEMQTMFETSVQINSLSHLVGPTYPSDLLPDSLIDIFPTDDDYVNSDDFYEEYPGEGEDIDTCEDDMDSLIDEVNGNFSDEEDDLHANAPNPTLPRPRMLSTVVDVSSASSDEELQQRQRRKRQGDGIIAYVQEKAISSVTIGRWRTRNFIVTTTTRSSEMSTLFQWTQDAFAALTPTAIYADAKQEDEHDDDTEKDAEDSAEEKPEKPKKPEGKEEEGNDNDGGEESEDAGKGEEEEEEEEEPEDIRPQIEEQCSEGPCSKAKHHFEQCAGRVASQAEAPEHEKENCVEEFFHLKHCVDNCTAPKLFAQLK